MLRTRRPLLALIALIALLGGGYAVSALRSPAASPATHQTDQPTAGATAPATAASARPAATSDALPVVAASSLPPEAGHTIALIRAGGPFPYSRDGVVFENREHLLPRRPSGYYHEYTVPTPGESDRGPRRIVTGDRSAEFFYTGDHYRTFVGVDPDR